MPDGDILQGLDGYITALQPGKANVRSYYKGKPLQLAEQAFGILFPPKPFDDGVPGLRELVEDVCLGRVQRAVAKAPRGGGKSFGSAFIEWYLNCFEDYDWLNLGGAEQQALAVYRYIEQFVGSHPSISSYYPKGTLMTRTENASNAWIAVLTASTKSIRSPHAGGIKIEQGVVSARLESEDEQENMLYVGGSGRGGGLTIDEECEADEDIVNGATPTVNTADPSVIIRISTFHKAEGTFQELVDNHEEMGYKLYSWDCFDICQPCTYDCGECFKDFREDVYAKDINTDVDVMLHRAYCGGKARMGRGWMPIDEIRRQFKEHQYSQAWFEVEMMGWRSPAAGHIIKDLNKFLSTCVVDDNQVRYLQGSPCTITIDWGLAGECCIQVWQVQPGLLKCLLEDDHFTNNEPEGFIYEVVRGYRDRYHTNKVNADSSHPYCNNTLSTNPHYRMDVREVNFQQEKDLGAGSFNAENDRGLIRIPRRHQILIKQVRNWRRKNGKIVKGNDHGCDAALCFFVEFVGGEVNKSVRIMPVTFRPQLYVPGQPLIRR